MENKQEDFWSGECVSGAACGHDGVSVHSDGSNFYGSDSSF